MAQSNRTNESPCRRSTHARTWYTPRIPHAHNITVYSSLLRLACRIWRHFSRDSDKLVVVRDVQESLSRHEYKETCHQQVCG